MRRAIVLLVMFATLISSRPTLGWNDKGHMVIARLAWLKLDDEQRQAATSILKTHPHYDEYLAAERPMEVSAEEWAFMRASYWPDWVRSNHSDQYNQPSWHYITAGFVPPGSSLKSESLVANNPNVVSQIRQCVEKLRDGTAAERPIYLCWLLHLTGDIHQPLHCCSLLSEAFPEGDRGGNLALVRIADGIPVQLHPTWDNLLGTNGDWPGIQQAVAELDQLERADGPQPAWAQDHSAADAWAKEGFELAKRYAYLNGDLRPANLQSNPAVDAVPSLAPMYLKDAEGVARQAAVRAGNRLANALKAGLTQPATASSSR